MHRQTWLAPLRTLHSRGALTLMATLVCAAAAQADVYLDGESLSYSENLNIESFFDSFEGGDFDASGDVSFTHDEVRLGLLHQAFGGTWDVALVARYDYYADYTAATAEIAYNVNNALPLRAGDYDLAVRLLEVKSQGVRVGYERAVTETLSLGLAAALLHADELTDGAANGIVNIDQAGDVTGTIDLDYVFTDDLLFGRDFDRPEGVGVTLDLSADWQPTDSLRVSLAVDDIWSEITWDDANRTIGNLDTQTAVIDENGLLQVRPTYVGQNPTLDYKQDFEPRSTVAANYQLNDRFSLGQSAFNIDQVWLYESRFDVAFGEQLSAGGSFEWSSGGLGLHVGWRGLRMEVASDQLDWRDAKYLQARVRAQFAF